MPDEVSVVLGAGGGIGRACVRMFADRGRRVVAADRDTEALRAAVAGIPGEPIARVVDVSQPREVETLLRDAAAAGALRDMVYAPGSSSPRRSSARIGPSIAGSCRKP